MLLTDIATMKTAQPLYDGREFLTRQEEKKKIFTAMYKVFNLMQNATTHHLQNEGEDVLLCLDQARRIVDECVHSTHENSGIFTNILNDPYVWDKPHS